MMNIIIEEGYYLMIEFIYDNILVNLTYNNSELFSKITNIYTRIAFITFNHIAIPSALLLYYYLANVKLKYNHSLGIYVKYGIWTWLISTIANIISYWTIDNINIARYSLLDESFNSIVFIFLFDIWFYFTHRLFHTPYLYKKYHKIHHNAINAIPFDALITDPVEGLFIANIFGIILMNLLHIHILLYYTISLASQIIIFINHSNLDKRHLIHHSKFKYNYSGSVYLDKLFGTEWKKEE